MLAKVKYLINSNENSAKARLGLTISDKEYVTVDLVDIEKSELELVYSFMNNLLIPKGHPKRKLFEKARHTSMSIGDLIEFEDETKFIVSDVGFEEVLD